MSSLVPWDLAALTEAESTLANRRTTGFLPRLTPLLIGAAMVSFVITGLLSGALAGRIFDGGGWQVIGFFGFWLVLLGGSWEGLRRWGAAQSRQSRVELLAEANGLDYERVSDLHLPGILFSKGSDGENRQVLTGRRGRLLQFGTRVYRERVGRYSHTKYESYVAIGLNRPLPRIVVDSVRNDHLGMSMGRFDPKDRVHLAGEFDEHFRVYAPQGYAEDVFYLFPPNLLAALIDNSWLIDFETNGDWMFIYAPPLSDDAFRWQYLMEVSDHMQERLDRWERWSDGALEAAPEVEADEVARAEETVSLFQQRVPGLTEGALALEPKPSRRPLVIAGVCGLLLVALVLLTYLG